MGTGVGEAMLISAATGAGTSAVMGGDPLKGALLGAATGGIGAGVAGGASGAAGAAGAAPVSTAAVGDAAANAATNMVGNVPVVSSAPATIGIPDAAGVFNPMAEQSTVGLSQLYTGPQLTDTAGQLAGGLPPPASTTPPTALEAFYAKNPIAMPAGLGALGSFIGDRPGSDMPGDEKYSGPLSKFNYDPRKYRPLGAASGGLTDTMAAKRMAGGGLGSYSDGGQLLKGPGDGMSDDIPASIGGDQPALLADGEFVVPADVVSGLGNGSTDAGARQLYAMMDAVRKARTGREEQAPEIDSSKVMPA